MLIRNIFLVLLCVLQTYFMILEMFLFTTPKGRKAFGLSEADAKTQAVLAANQGLYNGFLAAGLLWSVFATDPVISRQIALFFTGCVVLAGAYGGYSASRKILFIQALPALIAFVLSWVSL